MTSYAAVFSINDAYVLPFKVFFHSLCSTNSLPGRVGVFILHDSSLSPSSRNDLNSFCLGYNFSCHWVDCECALPSDLPNQHSLHRSTYFRLFVSELLPKSIDYAVYFDVDMIVVRDSSFLFSATTDSMLMAVDHCAPHHQCRLWGPTLEYNYLQAGLLLIPLSKWREHNVISLFMSIISERGPDLDFRDQDVLNLAFVNRWEKLPIWFNVDPCFMRIMAFADVLPYVHILHYSGNTKPWNSFDPSPAAQYWLSVYEQLFGAAFDVTKFRDSLLSRVLRPSLSSRLRGLLLGR
jgi:lipopolysaccharide biosynthesis glycosyltransferase